MSFSNVVWNKNESLDGYKLNKMINNDNINYNLSLKAPKGTLATFNIESLSISDRFIDESATTKSLTDLYVYNKNLPSLKKADNTNLKRYYKICISDVTIKDTSTRLLSSGLSANFPLDRGFFFVFEIFDESQEAAIETTKFGTTLRPGRSVAGLSVSAAASPTFWRSQAGEFIVPLEAQAFRVAISIEKYANTQSNNGAGYSIENGRIWVEDAGSEPF